MCPPATLGNIIRKPSFCFQISQKWISRHVIKDSFRSSMYKRRCDSCLRHSRADAARAGVTTEASALPASMTSPRMRPARPTLSSTLEPPRRRSGGQPARTIRQPWMAQCDQEKQSSMVMSLSLASMINCRLSVALCSINSPSGCSSTWMRLMEARPSVS